MATRDFDNAEDDTNTLPLFPGAAHFAPEMGDGDNRFVGIKTAEDA